MPRVVFSSGRKSFLLLIFAAAIIGGAWWSQRPPREPVHDGQRLSHWLARLESEYDDALDTEPLEAFGPGAIPWLTYTAEYGAHAFKARGPLPFHRAPNWLRRWAPERWGGFPRPSPPKDERAPALWALRVLGPKTASVIPALARIVESECGDEQTPVGRYAAAALQAAGPASWPVVERILDHGSTGARWVLLYAIFYRLDMESETEMTRAVAALTTGCHDSAASIREAAAVGTQSCFTMHPNQTAFDPMIPEITRLLSDGDTKVRIVAARTLQHVGPRAAAAIPDLIKLLEDPDESAKGQAAEALGSVDVAEKRSAARLRTILRFDPHPYFRDCAASALRSFGLLPAQESPDMKSSPAR